MPKESDPVAAETSASDHAGARVEAGLMPPWEVGELPEPPRGRWRLRDMLGPGLMGAGAAIGGGEWLMGPASTAQYGGTIMGLATISIFLQVAYNLEVMRYAVYCGEPIFVGFFRVRPGPNFWTVFYLIFDFFALWPYLAANAAVPLNAAFLGHLPGAVPTTYLSVPELSQRTGVAVDVLEPIAANPRDYGIGPKLKPLPEPVQDIIDRENTQTNFLAYVVFMTAFIPLIFGGKVYNSLMRLLVTKVVLVLGYLLFIGIFYVAPSTWAEIFAGFIFLSPGEGGWSFRLPMIPGQPIDWPLLAAVAAIAGQGGMNNSQFSNYARDNGWGMGSHVGAIPSAVGGHDIQLSHTGKVFPLDEKSHDKWKGWMHVLRKDQLGIWAIGCFLGMAVPSLLSLQFLRGVKLAGNEVAAASAQALVDHTKIPAFWFLTLFCGLLVLWPSHITAADGILRRWTDVIWTGSRRLRHLKGNDVKYVYYGLMVAYALWGLMVLTWLSGQQLVIVKASGVFMNFILGFSAIHTLAVNTILLPAPLRPNYFMRAALLVCGVFFIGIAVVSLPQTLRALNLIAPLPGTV